MYPERQGAASRSFWACSQSRCNSGPEEPHPPSLPGAGEECAGEECGPWHIGEGRVCPESRALNQGVCRLASGSVSGRGLPSASGHTGLLQRQDVVPSFP